MDYTKYVLKSQEELEGMLAGKDNLFVVACNKCFKEFETTQEPDCGCFTAIAEAQGKHITGSVKVDFLCNKIQKKRLQVLSPRERKMLLSFPADWACRRWPILLRFPRLPQPIL